MVLELRAHNSKKKVLGFLFVVLIQHSILHILLCLGPVFVLISVDTCIICDVVKVGILALIKLCEHGIVCTFHILRQIFVGVGVIFYALIVNTSVDEIATLIVESVGNGSKLRLHFALGIGHIVILVALLSGAEGLAYSLVESLLVYLLGAFLAHLLGSLVFKLHTLFLVCGGKCQLIQVVVGLSLLGIVGQLA